MKALRTCHRKGFKLIDTDIWEVQIDGKHSHYETGAGVSKNGESPIYPSYELLLPNSNIKDLPPRAQWYEYGTEFSPKVLKQRNNIVNDEDNIVQQIQDLVNERDYLKAQVAELTANNEQLVSERVTTDPLDAYNDERLVTPQDKINVQSSGKTMEDLLSDDLVAIAAAKLVAAREEMEDEYDFSDGERGKFVGTNAKERWRVTFDWDGNAGDKSEHWGFKNEKKAQNFINKLMDKYSAYEFRNVEFTKYSISE